MLITAEGSIRNAPNSYEQNGVSYFWTGLIWARGRLAGRDTAQYIAQRFDREGAISFKELLGCFLFAVRQLDGRLLVFADNSGLQAAYVSTSGISSNFVPHVEYLKEATSLTLDCEATAQTYAIGRVLSSRTLVEQIRRGDKDHYFEVGNGRIDSLPKAIADIDQSDGVFSPPRFYDDLSHALQLSRVSTALTGGFDSRMNFAFLNTRVEVLPCLSGELTDHPEAPIAMRVAREGGRELAFLETGKPDLDDATVERLVR